MIPRSSTKRNIVASSAPHFFPKHTVSCVQAAPGYSVRIWEHHLAKARTGSPTAGYEVTAEVQQGFPAICTAT